MKFSEECISLGLSAQVNDDSLLLPSAGNSTFYSNSGNDERSVVTTHSKFEPILKDAEKISFLVRKHDAFNLNNVEKKMESSPTSDENGSQDSQDIVEYGRLGQNKALSSVFVLDDVLLPLLRQEIPSEKSIQEESNLRSSLHLTYAKKFASRVCRFIEQYEKGVRIKVPDDVDLNRMNGDGEVFPDLKSLQHAATDWVKSISDVIESEVHQPNLKDTKGPMAEVDFWRQRHVILSGILEQVKTVEIKTSLEILRLDGSPTYSNLQEKINHLTKLSVEATENAKFLSTLERHLRTLTDGPLDVLVSTIPSLIDGMRMVWTVSRHYNRDERMVPLMEMIANQIALRVKQYIKLRQIMDLNLEDSISIVSKSKDLLETWSISYMETRARIERMGQGQRRWEFDRTRLFQVTDYMAGICSDLLQVIKTIDELKHLLGPDLVRITGENGNVLVVMEEIEALPKLLKDIQFDPFDRVNENSWRETIQTFDNMVSKVEKDAGSSIENAFRQLRSSEGAYNLVQQFKTMKSRPSIHHIIEERYQDIFQQYEKELETIEDHFIKYKNDPPIYFGHQTASGSISWANDLYLRAKRPILLFQQNDHLLNFGLGLNLKDAYLRFARSVDTYKEQVYNNWKERARIISNQFLRKSLLRIQGDEASIADSEYTGRTKDSFEQSEQNVMPSLIQVPKESCLPQHSTQTQNVVIGTGVRIQTNFSHAARELIDETKHFDAMGYSIPQGAMHLSLQEQTFNR